ncbi:hypothetical protein KDX38_19220 [Pseudomonas sp. CDFA 602]|uniref:hypothetical protein n=1 Tax=Pseudomonas californiensis TaxID=2829823 RepID=UPI001E586318|nr:hypothetical protein [Pseudomonas californiensis]MCD5995812.1 hypothetical protein [Pseudomonas californiensis]MCD6001335.1 hypothetical protein [Pseudomonas californiensis]
MSNVPPLFIDEVLAWDSFAAAALGAAIKQASSPEQAVEAAADMADKLVKERAKRIKAAKEQLFQH